MTSGASGSEGAPEQGSVDAEPVSPTRSPGVEDSGGETPEAVLRHLLAFVYNYEDKQAAIAAAWRAVASLQQHEKGEGSQCDRDKLATDVALDAPISSKDEREASDPWFRRAASEGDFNVEPPRQNSQDTDENAECSSKTSLPCTLEEFPNCKRLIDAYRKIFRIPNKTPLSVLYEYASRLNLELVFEESQEAGGPFTMEASLKDMDGTALYEQGRGTARAKRDSKQLAAASLLEILLKTVPFQDLLYKSDKQQQQKDMQANRMRWLTSGRGRGAFRGSGRSAAPQPLRPCPSGRQMTGALHHRGHQLAGLGGPFPGGANLPAEGATPQLPGLLGSPHGQAQHELLLGMPLGNTGGAYLGSGSGSGRQLADPSHAVPIYGAQHGAGMSSFGFFDAMATQAMIAGLPGAGLPLMDLGTGLEGLSFSDPGQQQQLGQGSLLDQGLLERLYQPQQEMPPYFQEHLLPQQHQHQHQHQQASQHSSSYPTTTPLSWQDRTTGHF